jgi:hypothetical protein
LRNFTPSGTKPTRVSSGLVSLRTATFMRKLRFLEYRIHRLFGSGESNNHAHLGTLGTLGTVSLAMGK